jgi:4-hydroxyphenylpyruvate dioxygenase
MKNESLGIIGLEAVVTYVPYLERSRRFYVQQLDFAEIGHSSPELNRLGRQRSAVFRAGNCTVIAATPEGRGGRAWRWLQRHPAGVGGLVWAVEDVEHTFRLLEARGATPIDGIQTHKDGSGTLKMFSITTPLGGATFRFVERRGYESLFPGFVSTGPTEHQSRFGFDRFDHVTSNFETMAPALLWMEHVMGFKRYWDVAFHTSDVDDTGPTGSGLRSVVMWDPDSGVKLANNEPCRPHFRKSQINTFAEEHRGDGVQHVAMSVTDILGAVRGLRSRQISFLDTPAAYYTAMPARLKASGVNQIEESIEELHELGILVDGDKDGEYLLQVFMKEASGHHEDPQAGPFFYELIQRKGNHGFGEGNFRALFESIERGQPAAEA